MDNPQEIKREKVRVVPIKYIDDFPDYPFKVVDDESMEQLIRSIDLNGVLAPVIARKKEEERYELISGYRRKHACEILGYKNPTVTFNRYVHSLLEHKKEMTNRLGNLLGNGRKGKILTVNIADNKYAY